MRGLRGPRPGGTVGTEERAGAGELEVVDGISVTGGLLPGIMVVMMIVDREDLQGAPLLTVMSGDVEEAEVKTGLHTEVVVTLVPEDPLPPVLTTLDLEMTDPVTGAKVRLVVESVAPSLEMTDQEIDQLVIKTTAGPESSVNPAPAIVFWGGFVKIFW